MYAVMIMKEQNNTTKKLMSNQMKRILILAIDFVLNRFDDYNKAFKKGW